jgi:uncharacterized protein (DUF4415 family)
MESEADDDLPDMATPYWQERIAKSRAGRSPLAHPKVSTTIRLDQDILDRYRSTGPGWQSRINEALRKSLP